MKAAGMDAPGTSQTGRWTARILRSVRREPRIPNGDRREGLEFIRAVMDAQRSEIAHAFAGQRVW